MKETKQFQTESKELLSLMINSIYSNKDIFLRELISNASDAIDKYKYLSISSNGKYPVTDGEIFISIDKKKRVIEIKDNGIGMNKSELENNLGTIAKSGSKEFLTKLKESKDNNINIIGQFGVGFYSAFMVANKIEVLTKKYEDKPYLFTSDGVEQYTIEDGNDKDIKDHGTIIKVYLKKNANEEDYDKYLNDYTIDELVKKYSDYIHHPIKMEMTESKPDLDKNGKEIKDKFHDEKVIKTLNSMIPIWKKSKKDVTDKELNEFYKNKFTDYEDPFTSLFIKVDGMMSYSSIIYIPSHAPYNLYSDTYEKGLDLYVKGIFIKDKCKELVPDYLKFIKGLVDSDDFSLNISREILQSSPLLKKMSDNIENKVVAKLKDIKNENLENYIKFFKVYGDNLKYGIYSTYGFKKDLLSDLLIYHTLNNENYIDLKTYKSKMDKKQKYIYFASGRSLESIKMLPQIEKYKKDGIDVLLLDSRIDEFALMMMKDYDKVEFKNIADESNNEVSEENKKIVEEVTVNNKRLLDTLKETLKNNVSDVIISSKLVDSPVCISTKDGLSMNMENVLNEEGHGQEEVKANKILEINPNHQLFKSLSAIKDNDEEVKKYASVLYNEALLLEGFEIKDKTEFVKNLNELMIKSLK